MKNDPVCNMSVREDDAVKAECDGEIYFFCSEGCKERFLRKRMCRYPETSRDLVIIGGGPAGLTAAVYAATLKVNAMLISKDLGGQAIDSTKIENYMGFDFITGPELVEKFKHQLIGSHYIDHLMAEVEKIETFEGSFSVITSGSDACSARSLIIATGMKRRKLDVPGEEEFQRKGIFYGNIQDISFVTGEDVAVVGGGNSALQVVENLQAVARNIYLVSEAGLAADPGIIGRISNLKNLSRYEGYKVTDFLGEKTLAGIAIRKLAGKEKLTLPVKGAFIAIGFQPNSGLVSPFIRLNERREIIINSDCSTSYPGIFAAGDVTNAFGKRIIIASGEGAKAALSARQYLLDIKRIRTQS